MTIKGIDGMSPQELQNELMLGGRFVVYQCISILVVSFRRSSNVFFVRAGESTVIGSLPYTLLSLFLGWWGFPWGPIYTVQTVFKNFRGGRDVTNEIAAALLQGSSSTVY